MVIEIKMYDCREGFDLQISERNLITVDVDDGITLRELAEEMDLNIDSLKGAKVNGRLGSTDFVLADGDKVMLYVSEI